MKLKNIFQKLLVIFLVFSWLFSGYPRIWQNPPIPPKIKEAKATITYFGSASTPADNGTNTASPTAVTPPANMQKGDLVILIAAARATSGTISMSNTGGQTWTALTQRNASANRSNIFWAVFNGTWSANPSVTMGSTTNNIVVMHVFRPTNTNYSWAVDVAESSGTYTAPASPYTVTINGITTNTDGALVFAAWTSSDDNTWGNLTTGWSTPGSAQYRNTSGNDQSVTAAYLIKSPAGATGNVSKDQTANGGDAGTKYIIAFKEVAPTTTLGNGTDPSNSTNGPGTTNYLDQFSFVTNTGTDTVTGLTVTTTNTSAIASMKICSNDDSCTTQYFNTVTSPSGNNWSFSGGTSIPVTTSTSSYRVVITAKDQSSLAEGTYAITGYVSAFTCSNTQAGSDSAGTTITIDNAPPSNATWGTITPGDQQVALNWSNPGSDFYKVLILRKAGSAITDAPTEGTEYSAPGTIGDSTIIYVNNGSSFTDTGLTNGTDYYYKIFAYDQYKNYASGAGTGPHQPFAPSISITISDGTVEYGIVPKNTAKTTLSSDMPPSGDMQTVNYDTNVTVNINIKGNNASGGGCTWTLASSNGADQYVHQFCNATDNSCSSPPTNYTALTTSYQALKSGVTGQGSVNFHLRLITPTESSCYGQQSVNVDVQAVQP